MLKTYWTATGSLLLSVALSFGNQLILFEDFEDAAVTYTSSITDELSGLSNLNYFGRIAPNSAMPGAAVQLSNLQGQGYYAAQDINDANATTVHSITLDWSNITTTHFTDLTLSWFVAEDDAADGKEDWDNTTSLKLSIQLDASGFNTIFAIEAASSAENQVPQVDLDFDGFGDGPLITDTFTQYQSSIVNADRIDIRLTLEKLNSADEDIAFDSLRLTGRSSIPEANSTALVILIGLFVLWQGEIKSRPDAGAYCRFNHNNKAMHGGLPQQPSEH
jgi:hypothetical protein